MNDFQANTASASATTVSTTASTTASATAGYWLGGWVFIPATLGSVGDRQDAYLERDGERVPLLHCSVDLTRFVELMIRIEAKLTGYHADDTEHE